MIYQFIGERKIKRNIKIVNSDVVYKLVKRYAKAKQEQFILITLNGAHLVISVSIISIGLVNKAIAHPREVYHKAITDGAAAIIVCHNHPSGEAEPSDDDKQVTKELYFAGEIIGIPLLDHIVFTKTGYTSLNKRKMFPDERRSFKKR